MTPLKWIKTKDGGCKTDEFLVEPAGGDAWRLVYYDKVMRQGTRDECKAQAAETIRIIARRPKDDGEYTDDPTKVGFLVGPPGTTVGAWKSENETGAEFLLRMTKEKGHHPRSLLDQEHVVRDAGLDLADYPDAEVTQLVREAFPLAQAWAKAYNAHPNALGVVEVNYNAWFRVKEDKVLEEDRRFLQALDHAGKADVPEEAKTAVKAVRVPKEPKGPAQKDEWGFRIGSGAAEINTGLSYEWKTAERVAKDSRSARAVHGHLKHLLDKNLIEVRGEGKQKEYRRVELPGADAPDAEVERAMTPKKKVVLKKKPK